MPRVRQQTGSAWPSYRVGLFPAPSIPNHGPGETVRNHFVTPAGPTQYSQRSDRRNRYPPATAGVANIGSPNELIAIRSALSPVRTTAVSPSSLTRYSLAPASTGEAEYVP